MKRKKDAVSFIPYRRRGSEFEFFLQKRSQNDSRHPGMVGVFGGGREKGESTEEALKREIREELQYVPRAAIYFCRYEHAIDVNDLYIERVGNDFESLVRVCDGDYGKFFTSEEVRQSGDVTDATRLRVSQLSMYLKSSGI